jgi:hypothetical protein
MTARGECQRANRSVHGQRREAKRSGLRVVDTDARLRTLRI